jgi:hypothetical protein
MTRSPVDIARVESESRYGGTSSRSVAYAENIYKPIFSYADATKRYREMLELVEAPELIINMTLHMRLVPDTSIALVDLNEKTTNLS